MSIILLRGFSHSGKDYVGNILCKDYNYQRFAFADSLKKMVANTFGCPIEQLHSQEGKLKVCESDDAKRTYRQILIDEALRLRNLDAGVFVKLCCQEILESKATNMVVTDWRYQNEIDIIQATFPNFKVIPVHIIRTGQEKSPVNDISEYQLADRTGDFILYNSMNTDIFLEITKLLKYINSI